MPDREKVMNGLGCCSQQRGGPELCEQCPYNNEPFPCANTLLHDALALLKEQDERIKHLIEDAKILGDALEEMEEDNETVR